MLRANHVPYVSKALSRANYFLIYVGTERVSVRSILHCLLQNVEEKFLMIKELVE